MLVGDSQYIHTSFSTHIGKFELVEVNISTGLPHTSSVRIRLMLAKQCLSIGNITYIFLVVYDKQYSLAVDMNER